MHAWSATGRIEVSWNVLYVRGIFRARTLWAGAPTRTFIANTVTAVSRITGTCRECTMGRGSMRGPELRGARLSAMHGLG